MLVGLLIEAHFGLPSPYHIPLLLLLTIPCGVDGLTQLIGVRESTNYIRVFTGLPAGIGIVLFVRISRSVLI